MKELLFDGHLFDMINHVRFAAVMGRYGDEKHLLGQALCEKLAAQTGIKRIVNIEFPEERHVYLEGDTIYHICADLTNFELNYQVQARRMNTFFIFSVVFEPRIRTIPVYIRKYIQFGRLQIWRFRYGKSHYWEQGDFVYIRPKKSKFSI